MSGTRKMVEMFTLRFSLAALLLLALGAAGPLQGQVCLDFVVFCDGLELSFEGDTISGFWRNYDCDGNDAPVWGVVQDGLPLPCIPGPTTLLDQQNPAKAGVACLPELDCFVNGDEWFFMLDGLDGTLDVGFTSGGLPPPGACGLDEASYDLRMGPCDFTAGPGGVPSTAAVR